MAVLTKADRETTIQNIMRESYAPRFAALMDKITEHANAELRANHPKFYDLLREEESRQYLAVDQSLKVRVECGGNNHCGVRMPTFHGKPDFAKLYREHWYSCDNTYAIKTGLTHPERSAIIKLEADHPLAIEHASLWASCEEAWSTVTSTLYSYNVRERFEADFPEFAKHLPAAAVKTKALTVPVADIRAKLQAAGVPPALQGA